MTTWLAVHDVPVDATEEDVKQTVERVRAAARESGVTPVDTFYSPAIGQVLGLFDAEDTEAVTAAHVHAGVDEPVVYRATRIPWDGETVAPDSLP